MIVQAVLSGTALICFLLTRGKDPTLPLIQQVYGGTLTQKMASIHAAYKQSLSYWSAKTGIPQSMSAAILAIESSGNGFAKDGRLIIRFEPHIFYGYTGQTVADTHKNQSAEYDAFSIAKSINENAAYLSISMGLAQVMGFNFKSVGYTSPKEMFNAFQADVTEQIAAMFKFIVNKAVCLNAAKINDFASFARGYNGSGYAKNKYDTKIADAKAAYTAATGIV